MSAITSSPSATLPPTLPPSSRTTAQNSGSSPLAGRVKSIGLEALGVLGLITMCALYSIVCATGLFAIELKDKNGNSGDIVSTLVGISLLIAQRTENPSTKIIPTCLRKIFQASGLFESAEAEYLHAFDKN